MGLSMALHRPVWPRSASCSLLCASPSDPGHRGWETETIVLRPPPVRAGTLKHWSRADGLLLGQSRLSVAAMKSKYAFALSLIFVCLFTLPSVSQLAATATARYPIVHKIDPPNW